MADYGVQDVKPIALIREAFGDEVVLNDENGESKPFQLLAEFEVGGGLFAVLQSETMKKNDEIDVFRIVRGAGGDLQLETVDDDEEWETLAELYDELTVSFDE